MHYPMLSVILAVLLPNAAVNAGPALRREAKIGPYAIDYYGTGVVDCGYFDNKTETTTLSIDTLDSCYKMKHSAVSFNVGSKKNSRQIPANLTLEGYASKTCTGKPTFFISEGSTPKTCFIQYEGFHNPIQSLKIVTA